MLKLLLAPVHLCAKVLKLIWALYYACFVLGTLGLFHFIAKYQFPWIIPACFGGHGIGKDKDGNTITLEQEQADRAHRKQMTADFKAHEAEYKKKLLQQEIKSLYSQASSYHARATHSNDFMSPSKCKAEAAQLENKARALEVELRCL